MTICLTPNAKYNNIQEEKINNINIISIPDIFNIKLSRVGQKVRMFIEEKIKIITNYSYRKVTGQGTSQYIIKLKGESRKKKQCSITNKYIN